MAKPPIIITDGDPTRIETGAGVYQASNGLDVIRERLGKMNYATDVINTPGKLNWWKTLVITGPPVIQKHQYTDALGLKRNPHHTKIQSWRSLRFLAASAFEQVRMASPDGPGIIHELHYPEIPARVLDHPTKNRHPLSQLVVAETLPASIEWAHEILATDPPGIDPGVLTIEQVNEWETVATTLGLT